MARLNLVSPWVEYYYKVTALFDADPEIQIIFDDEKMELKIYVNDELKADSLAKLFPYEKSWGDTVLTITVVPSNKNKGMKLVPTEPVSVADVYLYALDGNPHFYDIVHLDMLFDMTYVIFKNEVIQYYSDDIGDIYGLTSTLAENLARELFETPPHVYYCTDIK